MLYIVCYNFVKRFFTAFRMTKGDSERQKGDSERQNSRQSGQCDKIILIILYIDEPDDIFIIFAYSHILYIGIIRTKQIII